MDISLSRPFMSSTLPPLEEMNKIIGNQMHKLVSILKLMTGMSTCTLKTSGNITVYKILLIIKIRYDKSMNSYSRYKNIYVFTYCAQVWNADGSICLNSFKNSVPFLFPFWRTSLARYMNVSLLLCLAANKQKQK